MAGVGVENLTIDPPLWGADPVVETRHRGQVEHTYEEVLSRSPYVGEHTVVAVTAIYPLKPMRVVVPLPERGFS